MTPYKERFPVGARVRIAERSDLETFRARWALHNPLTSEQIEFAGCEAVVKGIGFYHGGDPLYTLTDVPGVWHEHCLFGPSSNAGAFPSLSSSHARRVIAGDTAIATATAAMEMEETLDDGWSRCFVNPVTGERWLETYMQGERHGGGYRVLIRLPHPERADWLELVAHSPDPTETWVAAMALGEDPESLDALLGVIMDATRRGEWQRVGVAAAWSGITSPMNRRTFVGKTPAQITVDVEHFERMAAEASQLLARAGEAAGPSFAEPNAWLDAPHTRTRCRWERSRLRRHRSPRARARPRSFPQMQLDGRSLCPAAHNRRRVPLAHREQ